MKIIIHIEDSAVKECVTTTALLLWVKSNKLSKADSCVKFVELEMINFNSDV
jgi:hypothetical protein